MMFYLICADMKKAMAVMLQDLMRRVDGLESQVTSRKCVQIIMVCCLENYCSHRHYRAQTHGLRAVAQTTS